MPATDVEPFAKLPHTAHGHRDLLLHAVVVALARLVRRHAADRGRSLDDALASFPFLADRFAEARLLMPEDVSWGTANAWWKDGIAAWEVGCRERLPLLCMAQEFGLELGARLAFVAVGLVEQDGRFGAMLADLQGPALGRRPTVQLIGELLSDAGPGAGAPDGWSLCRPLLQTGLVDATNRQVPRGEWSLQVPAMLWDAASGVVEQQPVPGWQFGPATSLSDLDSLIYPQLILDRLRTLPTMLVEGQVRTLIVRGDAGTDGHEVVGGIARRLGRGVVHLAPGATGDMAGEWLGPLCTLTGSLPVLAYELAPGETLTLPELVGYAGPVAVLLGPEGGVGDRGRQLTLSLPMPDRSLRLRHWRRALAGRTGEVEAFADRFQLAGGLIRQVGRIAVAEASLEGRNDVLLEDVRRAQRAIGHQLLDTLAERLEASGSWQQLITAEATRHALGDLERRCRHRERLLDHLGPAFGGNANSGVRALFTGASGTGKTLAARILAAELGMDLFRVDLAAVVNKYIGETEKNLHRVLARAEALDVILLLDEGDALLGSRTEVRSANDRYANLETNYLLQRLETYRGIVIVTTNLGDNIDRAFRRRMDVVVPFFAPQAEERRAILGIHLPERHAVQEDELDRVAQRCALTGGQLRNVASQASLLALDEGRPVCLQHLREALHGEYRKAGGTCLLDGGDAPADENDGGVAAFIDALRRLLTLGLGGDRGGADGDRQQGQASEGAQRQRCRPHERYGGAESRRDRRRAVFQEYRRSGKGQGDHRRSE